MIRSGGPLAPGSADYEVISRDYCEINSLFWEDEVIVPGVKGRGGRWFSYTHRNCKMQSKGQSVSFSFLKNLLWKRRGWGGKLLKGKSRASSWVGFLARPQSGEAATMCPKNENLKTPVLSWTFKQQLMPFEENLWRDLTCRAHSWDMRRKTRRWNAYFGSRICRWHVNDCTNWWGCKSQLLNVWGLRLSNWF